MTKAAISLGSNFNAKPNLRIAIQAIEKEFNKIIISQAYETSAVGLVAEDFINLVILVDTDLGIGEFFSKCKTIEKLVPLEKTLDVYRRGLDIDILTFGDFVGCYFQHKIPRPDLLHHNFALRPLAEIYPDGKLATNGKTFAQLWQEYRDAKQLMSPIEL